MCPVVADRQFSWWILEVVSEDTLLTPAVRCQGLSARVPIATSESNSTHPASLRALEQRLGEWKPLCTHIAWWTEETLTSNRAVSKKTETLYNAPAAYAAAVCVC